MSLDSMKWKEFRINEVFKVVNSKAYHKTSLKIGKIPYITRTSLNNGLEYCVANDNFKLNPKNTISLGAENADFFYQAFEYITGNKMYFIQKPQINKYTGLFLVKALQKSIEGCGFGYANGLTGTRLKSRFLLLPIDSKGNPNWDFMESYMKEIEQQQIKTLLTHHQQELSTLSQCNTQFSQDTITYKEFIIGEVFEVKATASGIDKNRLNADKGVYPYITRSEKSNGIDDFIAKQERYNLNKANVITIGLDTQTAFYQNVSFYTGQNIQILTHKKLNKYNALFVIKILKAFMEKFSWGGNGATLTRLKRGKILLPIDSKGNPNWEFMQSYMQALEKKHLEKITAYYEAKLNIK